MLRLSAGIFLFLKIRLVRACPGMDPHSGSLGSVTHREQHKSHCSACWSRGVSSTEGELFWEKVCFAKHAKAAGGSLSPRPLGWSVAFGRVCAQVRVGNIEFFHQKNAVLFTGWQNSIFFFAWALRLGKGILHCLRHVKFYIAFAFHMYEAKYFMPFYKSQCSCLP